MPTKSSIKYFKLVGVRIVYDMLDSKQAGWSVVTMIHEIPIRWLNGCSNYDSRLEIPSVPTIARVDDLPSKWRIHGGSLRCSGTYGRETSSWRGIPSKHVVVPAELYTPLVSTDLRPITGLDQEKNYVIGSV
ncbi:9570_t:CDS:2, partial [Funneliformis mosseae]